MPNPSPRWRSALPWLAVAFAAIACYAPTVVYPLLYDDKVIATSPLLARPFDVLGVFRNEFYPEFLRTTAVYRPLSQLSFLANWHLNELVLGSGDSGFGFHLPNILLHAAVCLLLLAWLRALPLRAPIPLVASLLFAVHPIHVEVVANVFGRSESMALLFGLGFLLAHRRGNPLVAGFLYLLSMWSKESGVTFLGVALAADFFFPVEETRFPLRRFAVYAAALGVWIALRAVALQGAVADTVFIDNPTVVASAYDRVLTAAAVQLDYLRLFVWPVAQSPDYSYAEREVVTSLADPRVLGFGLVLAVALVAATRLRKRGPIVALCVAGYAVLFSVTSNFLFPIGTIEGERLAYAPSIFVFVLAAACVRPALAAAVLVVVLGGLTVRQSRIWRDEPTFFREAAEAAPKSAKARQNLGTQFEHEGDYLGAAREFEEVVRIAPRYVYAWIVLGHLRRREGDAAGAAKAWHEALELDPGFSATRADLAHAFIDLGQRAEAASEARELFGRDLLYPRLSEVQNRLASGASPDESRAALAELEAARAALAGGDAKGAIRIAQELAAGPTLPAAERAQALLLLADAWESLGKAPRAGTYRKAAQQTEGRPVQESGETPAPARR